MRSPLHSLLAHVRADRYFTVTVLRGNLIDEMRQCWSRSPCHAAQPELPFTGLDFETIPSLQASLRNQRLGYPYRQAVAPLHQFRSHRSLQIIHSIHLVSTMCILTSRLFQPLFGSTAIADDSVFLTFRPRKLSTISAPWAYNPLKYSPS